ncbi:MAG: hypothetical protein ACK557_07725, partial [Planctomycetota bacterium]
DARARGLRGPLPAPERVGPRLADRWAAAGMMAGHPNETVPLGLRNVPFALQVGAEDAAYRRNEIGREWF